MRRAAWTRRGLGAAAILRLAVAGGWDWALAAAGAAPRASPTESWVEYVDVKGDACLAAADGRVVLRACGGVENRSTTWREIVYEAWVGDIETWDNETACVTTTPECGEVSVGACYGGSVPGFVWWERQKVGQNVRRRAFRIDRSRRPQRRIPATNGSRRRRGDGRPGAAATPR